MGYGKDAHPYASVGDFIDALSGSKCFSTCHLRNGCWQLSDAPKDREKATFVGRQQM